MPRSLSENAGGGAVSDDQHKVTSQSGQMKCQNHFLVTSLCLFLFIFSVSALLLASLIDSLPRSPCLWPQPNVTRVCLCSHSLHKCITSKTRSHTQAGVYVPLCHLSSSVSHQLAPHLPATPPLGHILASLFASFFMLSAPIPALHLFITSL